MYGYINVPLPLTGQLQGCFRGLVGLLGLSPSILTQTFSKTKTFNVNVSAFFIVVFEVRLLENKILVFVLFLKIVLSEN